jgi:hypothetical protein
MRGYLLSLLIALALFGGGITSASVAPPVAVAPQSQSSGNANVKVWVNTNSGVYHCPGTRWYGNTKQGEYMTQKQAQEKGYRPAYGKGCR